MNKIRKISIGPDYLKSMRYSVGQKVLDGTFAIEHIKKEPTGEVDVWITNSENETFKWKSFIGVPISIEYNIEF